MENKRIVYIEVARAIAMLYIIGFWHLKDYLRPDLKEAVTFKGSNDITNIMLGVFMFISGTLLSKYRFEKIKDITYFLYKRIKRFYILYFIAALLFFLFGIIPDAKLFLTTVLGVSAYILPQPFTLWFISMLFSFYIMTPFVLRDLKNLYVKNDKRLNSFDYQGLQVDIFPVDQKSRSYVLWRKSRWIYAWLVQAPQHGGRFMRYVKWNVPIAYHFLTKVLVPTTHFLSFKDKCHYYYRYGMFWRRKYAKADVFPLQTISFEGCMFPAPHNVDAYLKECYGDWRRLPPEKDRYNHQFGFKLEE